MDTQLVYKSIFEVFRADVHFHLLHPSWNGAKEVRFPPRVSQRNSEYCVRVGSLFKKSCVTAQLLAIPCGVAQLHIDDIPV